MFSQEHRVDTNTKHLEMYDIGLTAGGIRSRLLKKCVNSSLIQFSLEREAHHCVLIIDFYDDNGGVISQLNSLSKQLHILKNQQLVPSWAQSFRQHLQQNQTSGILRESGSVESVLGSTHLGDLALSGEEDSGKGVRQAGAVSSKQAASLVHVDPQLEDLLH